MINTGIYKGNREIVEYTIENDGLSLSVLNLGAAITRLAFSDGRDLVLGFDNYADYIKNSGHLGVAVVPNGNRIARSEIVIDGKTHFLEVNNNMNNLHSHSKRAGDKQFWHVEERGNELVLTLTLNSSVDYFPGNRNYTIVYRLVNGSLEIEYTCISDEKTVFNPTQHSYFNLNGQSSGTILNHKLQVNASTFTETDSQLIPTGVLTNVEGTPMDFRMPTEIGLNINADYQALRFGGGYDHNFCLDNYDGTIKEIASLQNDDTIMHVYTDMPGIQIYTGNFLGSQIGKGGYRYQPHDGVAMETQYYPDCLNHENFPSSILEANTYRTYKTIYRFEAK